jgi:uncharacterized membrane protein
MKVFAALRTHQRIIFILSTVALINAIYLTRVALDSTAAFCDVSSTFSCSSIFAYSWAWIWPVPFPAIAIVVYPILMYLATRLNVQNDSKNLWLRKTISIISWLGILFNAYFIIQETLVQTYCPLCVLCTLIIVTVFVVSLRHRLSLRN